jgi:ABC-type nitrate/sulfonate/bicarbonate transport system substrate-binding protein
VSMFDKAKDQAQKAAQDHPDQVEKFSDEAIERGGDAADKASGDKYSDKIDKGQQAADQRIGE